MGENTENNAEEGKKEGEGEREGETKNSTHTDSLEKLVARLELEKETLLAQIRTEKEASRSDRSELLSEIKALKDEREREKEKEKEREKEREREGEEGKNEAEQQHQQVQHLMDKIGKLDERVSLAEDERDSAKKELEEMRREREKMNGMVMLLQRESDEAKDMFNQLQARMEGEKVMETRNSEALQENMQSAFQVERTLLKGNSFFSLFYYFEFNNVFQVRSKNW